MSDVRERAGVAVLNKWHGLKDCPGDMYLDEAKALGDAALLAALDPEDEALVELMARAMFMTDYRDNDSMSTQRAEATTAIADLRAYIAQGEPGND